MQGFVIVTALLVTAFLQLVFEGKIPSKYTLSAMPMVVCSMIIYQLYPYKVKTKMQ
jgi:UDP-sugar transporter A1/2/3